MAAQTADNDCRSVSDRMCDDGVEGSESPILWTSSNIRNSKLVEIVTVTGPETDTSSFYWAHLSRFVSRRRQNPVSETSCFSVKYKMMRNAQNYDSYINMPSSQIHRF
jgi:hypothetical protein